MPSCVVALCKNYYGNPKSKCKNITYHRFPKDETMLKEWLRKCEREDINVATARICSEHFTEEDYKIDLKYKFGMPERKLLKPTAVPNAFSPTQKNDKTTDVSNKKKESNRKEIKLQKEQSNGIKKEDVTSSNLKSLKCKSCIKLLKQNLQHRAEIALLKEELKKLKHQNILMNQKSKKTNSKTRRLIVKFKPKIKKRKIIEEKDNK